MGGVNLGIVAARGRDEVVGKLSADLAATRGCSGVAG